MLVTLLLGTALALTLIGMVAEMATRRLIRRYFPTLL